ncbi:Sensor protein ZraS [Rosistilla carotiformis]|uniref:histidine kinase n=1 Tax=Rosistilla carotiformis TaxID=2528017 RepID=A0A518JMJ1_9BACT|nr:ATP-binding protein [Rosistilla carotiformis]QDV66775.1 Sensor protein ZraS [Rosistilla carotiformis]
MFEIHDGRIGRGIRRIAVLLAILSLTSLLLTTKILSDVHHEHGIMARLVLHLPPSDAVAAEGLLGELRLDRMLTILLVVNLIGTTIALALVVRGYLSSERSLRAVKVLATDILASMDAGVITTDRNGMISSTNPRAQTLIGMPDEGVGHFLSDLGESHALLDSICAEVRTYHEAIRDRDYRVTENGHRHTFRAGCTLLSNQQGEDIGTVLYVRDVTEKALIEERLRRMERYMGLGSLAAGLQHEIKNPLSAVSIHIQLLCEHLATEPFDPEVAELLEVLQTEVLRINNVLDGFRNYASTSEIGRSAVDVTLLIDKLVRLLCPQADRQGVKIKIESPCEMLGLIQADSVRLEQVFLNLALNAMAAMPNGGLLRFRVSQQNDQIRIDVADSGIGIPAEIQSQVFDPYFTTRNDGTGMGLALCDKIVQQHDGSIDFRSSPEGTEFTVLLPRGTQE